jgi:8-oxo-dGTP pyrophosphatase MutT (NUDIX family)
MLAALKQAFSRYSPSSIMSTGKVTASVVLPLYGDSTDIQIILTKRTTKVKYHKGEISFPGGMYEEKDGHTLNTAIRECHEEIGVKEGDIEIIGRLDDVHTLTGFIITPYVGIIPYPYDFKPNPAEVSYLIFLPLTHLLRFEPILETAEYEGRTEEIQAIYYNGERIWGATCRMLLWLKRIAENAKI